MDDLGNRIECSYCGNPTMYWCSCGKCEHLNICLDCASDTGVEPKYLQRIDQDDYLFMGMV